MSKLSFRLQIIAELVNKRNVCDIGCDHGKLANYLLINNIADKVIVSDISSPSLQKAIDLLSINNLNFEAICCDGLKGYKDKNIEQAIITGMGGDEIIKIISESPITIDSFILSPQHNIIDVKRFMLNNGYEINYDLIIRDKNKFYNIFRCNKSDKVISTDEFDLLFGKENFVDNRSAIEEFVSSETEKVKEILKNSSDNLEFINYLKMLNEYYKRK